MHVRLLAEFFLRAPNGSDFAPADFGIEWTAPSSAASERLNAAWVAASKHVVHFGRQRVPADLDDVAEFRVDGAHFRDLAGDALALYSTFVDAVVATTPEWTRGAGALIPDPEDDPEGWLARVRAEALRELRDAREEARTQLAT